MSWWKHAFAVDPAGPAQPSPIQQPAVDWACTQVARRRLTTPGLIALEMSRPLNYVTAQTMHFFRPGVWAIVKQRTYRDYVAFSEYLENRGSIEYLAQRVEHFEAEFTRLEKEGKPVRPYIEEHMKQVRAAAEESAAEDHSQHATTQTQ